MNYGKYILHILLFTVLLNSSLLTRALADILVRGGLPNERAVIQNVYAKFPADSRASTHVTIQFLDDKRMNAFLSAGLDPGSPDRNAEDSIDGIYQDDTHVITLRLPHSLDQLALTFAHEYGHYVWFNHLTAAQRRDYTQIYNHQRALNHLVTPYAATCLEEGFAEAYSFFIMQSDTLESCDSQSFDFLAHTFKAVGEIAPQTQTSAQKQTDASQAQASASQQQASASPQTAQAQHS